MIVFSMDTNLWYCQNIKILNKNIIIINFKYKQKNLSISNTASIETSINLDNNLKNLCRNNELVCFLMLYLKKVY